ncbi:hypothetical protein HPB51_019703 [Rhipicephalus microplus]|uniref:Uncharacterized protein n=1 Tax=Rhipicephalus microplus TaxID=6941 RepID=A0A9J6F598_RHIMP|nr:hypothetical protein HPB51_019703 [Rhipicephalus microplus]
MLALHKEEASTALYIYIYIYIVRLCYNRLSDVFQLSAGLRINAERITSIHLDANVNVKSDCLKKLFVSLAELSCLESLCFESPVRMDDSAARFAHLLIETKTLKHIQIKDCNARKSALEIIMKGLKLNQSVSHMEMDFSATLSSCTHVFVDMLKGNKTLTYLGHITTKKSQLHLIAEELHANRVLSSLKIWKEPRYEEDIFEINEILRRNVSHLNRVVEFALYPEKFGIKQEPAEILEELCDSQTFQSHLFRVAGPDHACEAMRYARRHITTNLFAITGLFEGQYRYVLNFQPQELVSGKLQPGHVIAVEVEECR